MSIVTAFPGVKFWWCILFAVDVIVKYFCYDIDHPIFCHNEFVSIW